MFFILKIKLLSRQIKWPDFAIYVSFVSAARGDDDLTIVSIINNMPLWLLKMIRNRGGELLLLVPRYQLLLNSHCGSVDEDVWGVRLNVDINKQHTVNTSNVVMWKAIFWSRLPIVFVRATLTAEKPMKTILESVVVPYLQTLLKTFFQQRYERTQTAWNSRHILGEFNIDHI